MGLRTLGSKGGLGRARVRGMLPPGPLSSRLAVLPLQEGVNWLAFLRRFGLHGERALSAWPGGGARATYLQ